MKNSALGISDDAANVQGISGRTLQRKLANSSPAKTKPCSAKRSQIYPTPIEWSPSCFSSFRKMLTEHSSLNHDEARRGRMNLL